MALYAIGDVQGCDAELGALLAALGRTAVDPLGRDPQPADVERLECIAHVVVALALIVVSGTVTTYLYYQSRTIGGDLSALEPQARDIIQNYDKNLPTIQKFVQELVIYGQSHPDFQPVLKKYGIPLTIPPATNSAPAK